MLIINLILGQSGVLTNEEVILRRKFFLAYDVFNLIAGIVASILSALMRLIFGIVFLIFGMLRAERSPMPGWVDSIMQIDKCSKATAAVIKMAHTHSNPAVCTFVGLLCKESSSWMCCCGETDSADSVKITPEEAGLKRLQKRFMLTHVLSKNKALKNKRKHFLRTIRDVDRAEEEAQEAAQEAAAEEEKAAEKE
jgi:hypothetical protein